MSRVQHGSAPVEVGARRVHREDLLRQAGRSSGEEAPHQGFSTDELTLRQGEELSTEHLCAKLLSLEEQPRAPLRFLCQLVSYMQLNGWEVDQFRTFGDQTTLRPESPQSMREFVELMSRTVRKHFVGFGMYDGVIDDYRHLFTAHGLAKPFFLSETIRNLRRAAATIPVTAEPVHTQSW